MATQIISRPRGPATSKNGNLRHLRLVRPEPRVDAALVNCLRLLLEGAETGEFNGLAFAVSYANGKYLTDAYGVCYDRPTMTLGMLSYLADEVRTIQHSQQSEAGN